MGSSIYPSQQANLKILHRLPLTKFCSVLLLAVRPGGTHQLMGFCILTLLKLWISFLLYSEGGEFYGQL